MDSSKRTFYERVLSALECDHAHSAAPDAEPARWCSNCGSFRDERNIWLASNLVLVMRLARIDDGKSSMLGAANTPKTRLH